EIQHATSQHEWRHIPSRENPADVVSRGLTCIEYLENKLWQVGPYWLVQEENQWPVTIVNVTEMPEMRPLKTFLNNKADLDIIHKFSSFTKLIRVTAYYLRFAKNTLHKKHDSSPLTTDELQDATRRIIKLTQHENLAREIHTLVNHRNTN
ncbi:uncharacterized protein LOC144478074, partial [Augochlora pura]